MNSWTAQRPFYAKRRKNRASQSSHSDRFREAKTDKCLQCKDHPEVTEHVPLECNVDVTEVAQLASAGFTDSNIPLKERVCAHPEPTSMLAFKARKESHRCSTCKTVKSQKDTKPSRNKLESIEKTNQIIWINPFVFAMFWDACTTRSLQSQRRKRSSSFTGTQLIFEYTCL